MQKSHPVIDKEWFMVEFSHQKKPAYPSELTFWTTATEAQKGAAIRQNPDLFRTGQGGIYMNELSRVRSINARNRHWLAIMDREMEKAEDMERLKKVRACLATYKQGSEQYATAGSTAQGADRIPQWQE